MPTEKRGTPPVNTDSYRSVWFHLWFEDGQGTTRPGSLLPTRHFGTIMRVAVLIRPKNGCADRACRQYALVS